MFRQILVCHMPDESKKDLHPYLVVALGSIDGRALLLVSRAKC